MILRNQVESPNRHNIEQEINSGPQWNEIRMSRIQFVYKIKTIYDQNIQIDPNNSSEFVKTTTPHTVVIDQTPDNLIHPLEKEHSATGSTAP